MDAIGQKLRDAREKLGLTLNEVERITRIRVRYLEMLEKGDFDAMPSIVQARGFLKNYAEFLGLNTSAMLDDFADVMHTNHKRSKAKPPAAAPAPTPTPNSVPVRLRRPRWLTTDLLVGVVGSLGVIAVLLWGGSRLMDSLRGDTDANNGTAGLPEPTSTQSIQIPTSSPLPAETEDPALGITPEATATSPNIIIGPGNTVDLMIVAEQHTWIRVSADGEERYVGRMDPGETIEVQGQTVVEIVTGNGGGVRVYFNGQDQGLLGSFSEVVIRLYGLAGPMTPTPTLQPSPTPTNTPGPTGTPTESEGE
ncbi:MAG TPA: helix-turn-helix domain-containing protein [Anaerolineae bacterium]|nr:helix-turn-helix domain-containing protein [Anaerolineae bacterium]